MEATGRSGKVSNLSITESSEDVSGSGVSTPSTPEVSGGMSVEEQSVQQLEQLLATMRLNLEQSELKTSKVGTVVADSVEAVGP